MLLIVATLSLSSGAARAEEQATGHYFPGGLSSFIDLLPENLGYSTFGYANESTYYHGSSNNLGPIAATSHANATSYSNSSIFLYQFPEPISILPGNPQYSAAVAVPYLWLNVHNVTGKHTDNGFGDVEMFPFMMGWTKPAHEKLNDGCTPNFLLKYQTEFGIYAPTGNFNNDLTANLGRNYWTFEPSAAFSYFDNRIGLEFTTSAGFDFNTKNNATHYQTGDQFHLDGTLAEHIAPYGRKGGVFGAGVSGFFYQQITGDSGRGAKFGSFEAMTTGVGPVLSYVYRVGAGTESPTGVVLGGQVQWLPELSVSNRLNGNIVWLKLAVSWGTYVPCPNKAVAPNLRALDAIPAL